MYLSDWEVKQLAMTIYANAQANPRKTEANLALAKSAIVAAIDFQIAWAQHGKLKQKELAKV